MSSSVYFVNAFSDRYYRGNTAAVVMVEAYPRDDKMLALAGEFGFSETAFVQRISANRYQIRWFTPEVEVNLCGHASLASAKALFSDYLPDADKVFFSSRSGDLSATRRGDQIELDFPADVPVDSKPRAAFSEALGEIKPERVLYSERTTNLVLVYPSSADVLGLDPDFAALRQLEDSRIHGIIATAPAEGDTDYICRYFAPWEGINEDPVTGSAQTCLGPYWRKRLGKDSLTGYQASARGGRFEINIRDDRVLISGKALIYMRGVLAEGWDQ